MATVAIAERTFSLIPANYTAPDVIMGDFTKHPQFAAAIADDNPTGRQLGEVFTGLRDGHAEIVGQLRKDVRTKTPARHFLDTHDAAIRWRDNGESRCKMAREAAERRIGALNSEIDAALRCPDDTHTDKLRDRMYAMKPEARMTFARSAIDSGDRAKMAAFMNGDAILCGFSDAEQDVLRTHAMEKHAPEPLAKKRSVEFAARTVSDAFTAAIVAVGTLFPSNRIADLRAELAELAAARDNLTV